MQQTPSSLNVQTVMREVRQAAREQMLARDHAHWIPGRKIAGSLGPEIAQIRLQIELLEQSTRQLGEMPPTPPTLRARASRLLVRVVHRATFWIWPPLRQEFDVVARTLQLQLVLQENLLEALIETREMVERLRQRVDEFSEEV